MNSILASLVILFNFSIANAASSASVNGVTYTCNGSLAVINGTATCNGKDISDKGQNQGPCGGSKTIKAPFGSGEIDVLAKVSGSARIDGTVCGEAIIGDAVTIQRGALVNGAIKIDKNTMIKTGSTLNGGGVVGPDVIINEQVTINGKISIKKSSISKGTTLNGNIYIEGVAFSGDISCSGNGTIRTSETTKGDAVK